MHTRPAAASFAVVFATLFAGACGGLARTTAPADRLVDPEATGETRALYANLKRLAPATCSSATRTTSRTASPGNGRRGAPT